MDHTEDFLDMARERERELELTNYVEGNCYN